MVKTNIRSFMDVYEEYWEYMLCGSALASVAHVLGNGLERVLIGSTLAYGQLQDDVAPHPLTDPLFSSSRLEVLHDAAQFNRVQKIFEVARNKTAMKLGMDQDFSEFALQLKKLLPDLPKVVDEINCSNAVYRLDAIHAEDTLQPLVWDASRQLLYLRRYWQHEKRIAEWLKERTEKYKKSCQ